MNRTEVIKAIGQLETNYCDGCPIKSQRDYAEFCVTFCNIGKQIRELGKKIEGTPNKGGNPGHGRKFTATKEELAKLAREYSNKEIADIFGVAVNTIAKYKRKWGLTKSGRKGA